MEEDGREHYSQGGHNTEDWAAGHFSIWIFTSSQEAHKKKVCVFVNAPGFDDSRWAGSTTEECEVVRKHET